MNNQPHHTQHLTTHATARPATVQLTAALLKTIQEECALYRTYLAELARERAVVVSFARSELEQVVQNRSLLTDQLAQRKERRDEIHRQFPRGLAQRLTDTVREFAPATIRKQTVHAVEELRHLVTEARRATEEHRRITSFAAHLVQGTMSILWSATHSISQVYGKSGQVTDRYVRESDRSLTTLREV